MKKLSKVAKIILVVLGVVAVAVGVWCIYDKVTSNSEEIGVTESDLQEAIALNKGINPYTITVNGVKYDFPMSYDDFIELGWSSSNESCSTEDLGKYMLGADCSGSPKVAYKVDGVDKLWVHFYNIQESDKELKDCMVVGLSYNSALSENKLGEDIVKFSKDDKEVVVGKSTMQDVKDAFGEPSNSTESEDSCSYMYWDGANTWVLYLYFDSNGVVNYFTYNSNY